MLACGTDYKSLTVHTTAIREREENWGAFENLLDRQNTDLIGAIDYDIWTMQLFDQLYGLGLEGYVKFGLDDYTGYRLEQCETGYPNSDVDAQMLGDCLDSYAADWANNASTIMVESFGEPN